ncbi:class I SAM-dependent methyltransferase [Microbacterium sp. NPDC076911]|uniref:class I SAM-dependent methyltransferase n=1 Tax=Microbacterium sp. NPDC076911 TaxID=3154958 RepID=UPI0034163208
MENAESRFATAFARVGPTMDQRGADQHRRELVAGLSGEVVEVGAGYGATFPFYSSAVRGVTAVEPDEGLRRRAQLAATASSVPIRVVAGTSERIPVPTGTVDAVVFSLVLCSVGDQAAALAEAARVLRPDGVLAFYEHVRSRSPLSGAIEDLVTPVWRRIAGNCHPNRDTVGAIVAAGFRLQRVRRFGFSVFPAVPRVSHVIGRALRPV